MWDLPGPGLKPVSPALAGRFLTTAPPGKLRTIALDIDYSMNYKAIINITMSNIFLPCSLLKVLYVPIPFILTIT